MLSYANVCIMTSKYYQIKDKCRSGLLEYLAEAVSLLPKINNPKILDIGCGTGIPTIWLAENYGGTITAVDTDNGALRWLRTKIIDKKLEDQITTINISFFDLVAKPYSFDIIIAAGFLNVIGFEIGYVKVLEMIKKGGYFIIHDEFKDHEMKCEFIRKNQCDLIGTLFLDESIWWMNYYRQLEEEVNSLNVSRIKHLFASEMKEIKMFKSDPSLFKSMYYIVKRQ